MIDVIIGITLLVLVILATVFLVVLNIHKEDIWEMIEFEKEKNNRTRRKKRRNSRRKY